MGSSTHKSSSKSSSSKSSSSKSHSTSHKSSGKRTETITHYVWYCSDCYQGPLNPSIDQFCTNCNHQRCTDCSVHQVVTADY